MKISSPDFESNQMIPADYTCEGANVNPELHISDIPDAARSLVLIMDDPDAAIDPEGSGVVFIHWLVWNIDPDISKIEANSEMQGIEQGFNSGGSIGYTGPCPPTGVHHYRFKLYALSSPINVSQNISREELESVIEPLILEKDELVGLYKKNNGN